MKITDNTTTTTMDTTTLRMYYYVVGHTTSELVIHVPRSWSVGQLATAIGESHRLPVGSLGIYKVRSISLFTLYSSLESPYI